MFIDFPWKQGASSGGATGAEKQASMSLLRSFGRFSDGFYKHVAPPALRLGSRIRRVFQQPAKIPEVFTHDLDGNLTADGRFSCTWDGENRLIAGEALATTPATARVKVTMTYDAQSRRVQKQVHTWNTGRSTYQLSTTTRFLYDAWNLLAELNASNQPVRSYTWGLDLSGSLQEAGGVGGLLVVTDATNGTQYLPAYDGNGNLRNGAGVIGIGDREGGEKPGPGAAQLPAACDPGRHIPEPVFERPVAPERGSAGGIRAGLEVRAGGGGEVPQHSRPAALLARSQP